MAYWHYLPCDKMNCKCSNDRAMVKYDQLFTSGMLTSWNDRYVKTGDRSVPSARDSKPNPFTFKINLFTKFILLLRLRLFVSRLCGVFACDIIYIIYHPAHPNSRHSMEFTKSWELQREWAARHSKFNEDWCHRLLSTGFHTKKLNYKTNIYAECGFKTVYAECLVLLEEDALFFNSESLKLTSVWEQMNKRELINFILFDAIYF